VVRVESHPDSYLLKYHHWAGFWKTASKALTVSPNRHSFEHALRLIELGLPTPRPLACLDVRLGPLNVCSYLVTEFIPGESLYRLLRYQRLDEEIIDCVARQIAEIWQLLDDAQFSHNDLKPENFMIDRTNRVWLIDLESGTWHRDRRELYRAQSEDAARLLHPRSWRTQPRAGEMLRQRLLATPAVQAALAGPDELFQSLRQSFGGGEDSHHKLTVLIPCYDATDDLHGCIESVRDFADEILIVDSGARDGARRRSNKLTGCHRVRIEGFHDFHRRAIESATYPWVLWVEPNERISTDLAKEIQFLLAEMPSSDAYPVKRRNYCFGRPVRFGDLATDYPLRLFRRGSTVPLEIVTQLSPPRAPQRLNSRLIRHWARSVEELAAHDLRRAVEKACAAHHGGCRFSPLRMMVRPLWRFLHSFVLKLGFFDGWTGLHLAILAALFTYIEEAKLWEIQHGSHFPDFELPEPWRLIVPDPSESEPNVHADNARPADSGVRRRAA